MHPETITYHVWRGRGNYGFYSFLFGIHMNSFF